MNDDRERVAYHEAGHAVMAFLLGHRLGPVTIVPTSNYAGLACHDGFRFPEKQRGKLGRPLPLLPAALRRSVELGVMVSLAGPAAEHWLLQPTSGYIPTSSDEKHAEKVLRLVAPTPREARRLEEADQEADSDEDRAARRAWALTGDSSSAAYFAWLQAHTREIVVTPRFGRLVAALVPPLLEHRTLSGRAVREILRGGANG